MQNDPWKGLRPGDGLYRVHAQPEHQIRCVVTHIWFDPVRGEDDPRRGYMVGVAFADEHWRPFGGSWSYSAAYVAGRTFVRREVAERRAREMVAAALGRAMGAESQMQPKPSRSGPASRRSPPRPV